MQKYFDEVYRGIMSCTSEIESRVRVVSCIRLLLQQTTYGLLEWVGEKRPPVEHQPEQQVIQALRSPSDGSLVDALESLLISCEQLGWTGAARLLIRPVGVRPAQRVCGSNPPNTLGVLRGVVALRNDGAEGHGLVGGYDREAELDALAFLLEALSPVIPEVDEDKASAFIGSDRLKFRLSFVRGWNGAPALIRRIKVLASDRVRAYCQISQGGADRSEFNYDAINPFQSLSGRSLPSPIIWENSWSPLCYLPDRTTDSFTGRSTQLQELKDWLDDSDSRACLIYGDGGFGKTTLALEFLHRVLDEEVEAEWKPRVVLFYTAKRWQWGLNGLQPIAAGQPHLLELIAFIHMLLFGSYPPSEFYKFEVQQAASALQNKIKDDLGLSRQDILVIVDNAETLIESEEERVQLGRELKEVSRRIGRILLTSRRREHIEASPIAVDVLSEYEAISFLRDRARKLNLKIVQKANDLEILKAVQSLERRPIVLEAFASSLADPATRKIDDAAQKVAAMLRKDLGDFLFADAWSRLSQDVRRLLLLMTRIGDVHDSQSLRICSSIIGVSVQVAEQALEESGGIASMISVQGSLQITFSKNFLEYAREKTVALAGGASSPSSTEVNSARQQYSNFIRNAQRFTGDRVVQAFRTPQAKAAHRARQQGEIDESYRLYQDAILTDSTNGWLRDRFAYFLFRDRHDNEAALHQAKTAVELLPQEGEVWLTRGLVEARSGDVRASEISLAKAEELGVDWSRCSIQRTWAYLKAKPAQLALASKELVKLKTHLQGRPSDSRLRNEIELLDGRLSHLKGKRGARRES